MTDYSFIANGIFYTYAYNNTGTFSAVPAISVANDINSFNVSINTTSISIVNSTVSFSLISPTAAQVSGGNYYLNANGQWVIVSSGAGSINTASQYTFTNVITFSNTISINAISANGGVGTAGQLLASNGTAAYWTTVTGGGTVSSIATGNGLSGGPITTTGTISLLANTGIISNSTGVYVNSTYISTLTSNNVSYVGSVTAANVVSNTQLSSNLANYQTTAGLASNVATLAANSATYLGGNTAADLRTYSDTKAATAYTNSVSYTDSRIIDSVTNTSIVYAVSANSVKNAYDRAIDANTRAASAQTAAASAYSNAIAYSGNAAAAYSNAVSYVDGKSYVNTSQLSSNLANYQTTAGLASNVAILTSNNASYLGGVIASGYQTSAGLSANVATLAANSATYLGGSGNFGNTLGVFSTGTVNAVSHTVGASFTANSTVVNAVAYYSGTLLVANTTVSNATHLGGVSAASYQLNSTLSANVATLTSNNTSYVGTVTAANVVSNTQLSSNLANYAPLAGATFTGPIAVNSNVTITGNLIVTGTTFTANVTNLDVKDLNITVAKGAATNAATDTAGLTVDISNIGWYYNYASNTWQSNVGITPSANLSFNLGTSTLQWSNVYANNIVGTNVYGTLQTTSQPNITANNTSFVGSVSAANVVSNTQLSSNLANYQTTAGLSANVATLTANNTSFVGTVSAANVVSNTQLSSNLANYQTTAGLSSNVATLAANSATYLGGSGNFGNNLGIYSTGVVNAVSHSVGTSFTANSTVVNAVAYYSGTLFVANSTVSNATHLGGVAAASYVQNTDSRVLSGNLVFTGANIFLQSASLGGTATNFVNNFIINTNVGNASYLRFYHYRYTTGGDWTGVSTRIQQRIDVSDMGYIEFNPAGYTYGMGLYGSSGYGLTVTQTGQSTFGNTVILGSVGLSANGSLGTSGQVLTTNGTTTYWSTVTGGGGSGANSTGGSGAIQYYNGSTFGSSANLIFNGSSISIGNSISNVVVNSVTVVASLGASNPNSFIMGSYTTVAGINTVIAGPYTISTGNTLVVTTGSRIVIV